MEYVKRPHIVYCYFFADGTAYVGQTSRPKQRKRQHQTCGPIKRKIDNGILANYTVLEEAIIGFELIKSRELYWHDEIKRQGWDLLNRARPGSLGGGIRIWTDELLSSAASAYQSVREWRTKDGRSYCCAVRRGLVPRLSEHMKRESWWRGYWTIEKLLEDARKYTSRNEWMKASCAYQIARRENLLDICCTHMQRTLKPHRFWKEDTIRADALLYSTRAEWKRKSSGAYDAAMNLGIAKDCCRHMELQHKPNGFWTKERLMQDAIQYHSRFEWRKGSPRAYSAATRLKLLKHCAHSGALLAA